MGMCFRGLRSIYYFGTQANTERGFFPFHARTPETAPRVCGTSVHSIEPPAGRKLLEHVLCISAHFEEIVKEVGGARGG